LNHLFFAHSPRHWDDFRVILPGLFGKNGCQEKPQIC
jgi:hypothetical protein